MDTAGWCGVEYIFGCRKFSASLVNGQNDSSRHIICLDYFFVFELLEESFQPYILGGILLHVGGIWTTNHYTSVFLLYIFNFKTILNYFRYFLTAVNLLENSTQHPVDARTLMHEFILC